MSLTISTVFSYYFLVFLLTIFAQRQIRSKDSKATGQYGVTLNTDLNHLKYSTMT